MLTTKQYKAEKRKLYGGIDRNVALKKGFRYQAYTNTNKITWRKNGTSLTFNDSEVKHLNCKRLQNMWAFAYNCNSFELVNLSEGIIKFKEYRFELDNPFRCDRHPSGMLLSIWLEEKAKEKAKENYWVTKDNRKIPFEELSDMHLANIFGKAPNLVPEGLKLEAKKRFGGIVINQHLAEAVGCCQRGIEAFKRKYEIEEEEVVSLTFLINRMDFEPNFIGSLIKEAIIIDL